MKINGNRVCARCKWLSDYNECCLEPPVMVIDHLGEVGPVLPLIAHPNNQVCRHFDWGKKKV